MASTSKSIFNKTVDGKSLRPLESTRNSMSRSRHKSDDTMDQEKLENIENCAAAMNNESMNLSYINDERNQLKHEFKGLNHRLISYMDHVKQKTAGLAELEIEKNKLENQMDKMKTEHSQQISMLRGELDEHIRQAVMSEEQQLRLEAQLQTMAEEQAHMKNEIKSRREREASLERLLCAEKNELREARADNADLRDRLTKAEQDVQNMNNAFTQLKVDHAKLKERMKITAMELTMQETKVSETEKKLQYTSEDVKKQLNEQRKKLEKLGMEKLEEMRQKQAAEVERVRKECQKNMSNALITYVSREEYAKLDTEAKENLHRAENAELQLEEREKKILLLQTELSEMKTAHEKEMAKERRKRERLDKKLKEQTKGHDDIKQELENYRKLIEGLDVNDASVLNTPFGAKRIRSIFEGPSPIDFKKPVKDTVATPIDKSKLMSRRIVTPLRRLNKQTAAKGENDNDDDDMKAPTAGETHHRDCKVM